MPSPRPAKPDERQAVAALITRRAVPAAAVPAAHYVLGWTRTPLGRATSSPVFSVLFALSLVGYVISGFVAVGVLALLFLLGAFAAFAVWGGARTWARNGYRAGE